MRLKHLDASSRWNGRGDMKHRAKAAAVTDVGPGTIVVNNAGLDCKHGSLLSMTWDDWNLVLDTICVNILVSQQMARRMCTGLWPTNIGSGTSVFGYAGPWRHMEPAWRVRRTDD